MTTEQFCYWLQGFAEIKGGWEEPTAAEWAVIKDHLNLVFKKETPDYNIKVTPVYGPEPAKTAEELKKSFEEARRKLGDPYYIDQARWWNSAPGIVLTC